MKVGYLQPIPLDKKEYAFRYQHARIYFYSKFHVEIPWTSSSNPLSDFCRGDGKKSISYFLPASTPYILREDFYETGRCLQKRWV